MDAPRNFYHLLQMTFHIPSYQRGYRWEKKHIFALLNDLKEFCDSTVDENSVNTYYCLQPIVVKGRPGQEGHYDVIDGQQRLTTIYLLLTYLENVRRFNSNDLSIYDLIIEERDVQNNYLAEKRFKDPDDVTYKENIDNFFLRKAYDSVCAWFEEGDNKGYSFPILQLFVRLTANIEDEKRRDVRVIWYDVNEEENAGSDTIDIFTRLNYGQIPLTSTELVKAMILQVDTYRKEELDVMKEKSISKAMEWDEMEKALQDRNTWGMLTPEGYERPSHISLMLDYLADVLNEEKNLGIHRSAGPLQEQEEDRFSYDVIEKYLKTGSDLEKEDSLRQRIEVLWQKLQDIYNIILTWRNDPIMYHRIGLLGLLKGKDWNPVQDMKQLYRIYDASDKDRFKEYLRKEIGNRIRINKKQKDTKIPFTLETVNYTEAPKELVRILEAFNVDSFLEQNGDKAFFPFDTFKKFNVTSLEHIHPQNLDEDDIPFETLHDWYEKKRDALQKFEKKLKEEDRETVHEAIRRLDSSMKDENAFESGSGKEDLGIIDRYFNELSDIPPEHLHTLYNMALVDKDTNAALGANLMDKKRETLINREKEGKTYVPICTERVFNKFYNTTSEDMKFWNSTDRKNYFEKIKAVYEKYTLN